MIINSELEQQVREAGNHGIPMHRLAATLAKLSGMDMAVPVPDLFGGRTSAHSGRGRS